MLPQAPWPANTPIGACLYADCPAPAPPLQKTPPIIHFGK